MDISKLCEEPIINYKEIIDALKGKVDLSLKRFLESVKSNEHHEYDEEDFEFVESEEIIRDEPDRELIHIISVEIEEGVRNVHPLLTLLLFLKERILENDDLLYTNHNPGTANLMDRGIKIYNLFSIIIERTKKRNLAIIKGALESTAIEMGISMFFDIVEEYTKNIDYKRVKISLFAPIHEFNLVIEGKTKDIDRFYEEFENKKVEAGITVDEFKKYFNKLVRKKGYDLKLVDL